jgi:hydrogenase maturation protein HypF
VAKKLGLTGYVVNKGSEVEVVIDRDVDTFITQVKQQLPSIARITSIEKQSDTRVFPDFRILYSKNGKRESLLPVDVATCDACLSELFNSKDRRFMFPFTNCTVCGARFSLIEDVPYDRERTSMRSFPLCENCAREYQNPSDRRYHAQTISCPICGPSYHLYDAKHQDLGSENAIKRFAEALDNGSIGVLKSWGGMHLCSKLAETKRFRIWYNRPQKAFAVMVRDIATAKTYAEIAEDEEAFLCSNKRPVVLVKKKKGELTSPGLDTIGLFLPYTGLHHILFSFLSADALIMTSANIPGEPMLTKDEEVFSLNADVYLLHNRRIPNRVDDSVVRLWKGHRFFLRKSRGFVPEALPVSYKKHIVSVGAGQNVYGAVSAQKNIYNTQYLGDTESYNTLQFLERSLRHLIRLFLKNKTIDGVVMDLHPGYESRRVAQLFAEEFSCPLFEVQHHWAHAAALLVDSNTKESVVLTLDGLGYGADDTFWGGEVLAADFSHYNRVGHLEHIPLLGGDQATLDPRRLVFAIFKQLGQERYFSGKEAHIFSTMIKTSPVTSSMGRILDALSCYLGICSTRTYDGEPAMKLEKYLAMGKPTYPFHVEEKKGVVSTIDVFRQLDDTIRKAPSEQEKANLAYSMVKAIMDTLTDVAISHAEKKGIETIGLTGGVSYNIPLTEMVENRVKTAGLELLVHHRVPNGDGCIAIGQNAIIGHKLSM